jgi:drug/metabolite transporter (DMT)-like permease
MTKYHLVAFLCVVAISAGQVLFKTVAFLVNAHQTVLQVNVIATFLVAMFLYSGATFGWIWVLQFVPISRVYPYFAASFAIVPLASAYFFGEALSVQYFVGIVFVVAGVLLSVSGS